MPGNLKSVIKVRTLADGQFEVSMALSERKSRTTVKVSPQANAGDSFVAEETNQNILPFRRSSLNSKRKR